MSFGKYLYAGGFIQKNSSRDHCHTLQTSKPTTTCDSTRETYERWFKMKPKPRHQKEEPTRHYTGSPGPLGRPPSPWGWPITLRHRVLLPTIYTVDSKVVFGRFIQRWSRELMRIDDMAIPCPLLLLESLPLTPLWFLGRYSTSSLYIAAPTPLPHHILKP